MYSQTSRLRYNLLFSCVFQKNSPYILFIITPIGDITNQYDYNTVFSQSQYKCKTAPDIISEAVDFKNKLLK